jgi:hypothetical protein
VKDGALIVMLKIMNNNIAAKTLLLLNTLGILFHILVVLKIVPYSIVWGGRANNENYLILEMVSLLVLVIASFIIAGRAGFICLRKFDKIFYFCCWLLFAVFILNTIGNLTSSVQIERYFFSTLTFVTTLLLLIINLKINA